MLQDADKRIFNYYLSKARRTSENAFGIMNAIFRSFFTPIHLKPGTIDLVIIVYCCLHNMLSSMFKNSLKSERFPNLDDFPTQNLINLAGAGSFAQSEGFQVRRRLTDYFSTSQAANK